MKTRLRYCVYDPDPRGNDRYYIRKKGRKKIRIHEKFEDAQGNITKEFMAAYWAALELLDKPSSSPKKQTPREDTFDWLCDQYFRSAKFQKFDEATQRDKRSVLNRFCETAGSLPYKKYRRQDMEASQLKRKETPGAADKLVKVIRALFNWAMKQNPPLATSNPAIGIEKLNAGSEGFHTWTIEEVQKFRETHAIGTKARLALEIMLNVGARISDASRLGRQHESAGWLRFTAYKNRNKHPTIIEVRMTADLKAALAATETGDLTYLVTEYGASFTINGLGNRMREWCDAAGLFHCSAHGLRKAAAVMLAESGATAPELCAIFGWSKLETAETYIRKAQKRKMADNAFTRLDEYRNRKSVSLLKAKRAGETKHGKKHGKSTPN
ncbi:tyrosine-type recombinase/integrase [Sinorhizobium meliloti]|uniref:tyrosine-type recombinase/integrase n=1 Tax=Rhizobium meliloti TaxID=382 RepID=UPI00299DD410|nr:tyrosine-type recombinase/integrase [Sinorhizobium meliloti]MDW9997115.1 tyrosine-type recombinase/integrase [Sinorhizobium meliloti]